MSIEKLLKNVSKYNNNIEDFVLIMKAYNYADTMHKGQVRESGEEYITHPLNVAYILSEMHADTDTLCAALLHDTLEDTKATKEELTILFNSEIAKLVDGVTKISKLNFSSKSERESANMRKIINGITEDVRIIIIKLADRLHNMRTLEYKTPFKQKENSVETLDVFVPLAYYIGAYRIKESLEDISFKYLKPDEYKKIEDDLNNFSVDYNECLLEMLNTIDDILNDDKIPHDIKVRTKNIYGIYRRFKQGYKFSEIYDLLALKVMVDSIKNCYITLGLVHSKYHPLNAKFKDYIANPKTNMYRSLHTTIFTNDERLVQAQIRTFEMDKIASFGLPAYWDINKGNARDAMQDKLRRETHLLTALKELDDNYKDNEQFVKKVKSELFDDNIYVYTMSGEIIEMPPGSTIIDFAYRIHTDIGNSLEKAEVNELEVPLTYILKNNDRIKLYTNNNAMPSINWINIAKTTNAKRKIKEFIKKSKSVE